MSRLCSWHHLPRGEEEDGQTHPQHPTQVTLCDPFHSHICQCIGIRSFWEWPNKGTGQNVYNYKYSSLGQALEKNFSSFFIYISTIFFSPSLEECHFPYYQGKSHGWPCREKFHLLSSPCSSPALSQAPWFAQSWNKRLFEQKQATKQHVLHWPILCFLF